MIGETIHLHSLHFHSKKTPIVVRVSVLARPCLLGGGLLKDHCVFGWLFSSKLKNLSPELMTPPLMHLF